MKSFDLNQLKYGIAQKYGIPESEIDESVLTLYLMIDLMKEESIKLMQEQKDFITQSIDQISQQQTKKLQPIIYDNPTTAFWGNLGSIGISGIAVSITVIVIGLLFSSWHRSQELIKNLEALKSHVQVREDGYYINQKSYVVVKGGILITP